jgi:hypothetical protein
VRWNRNSARPDTIAQVPVPARSTIVVGGLRAGARTNPFDPAIDWAVSPGGDLAIVHPDPYRVEIIDRNGLRQLGPAVEFEPVAVTDDHKAEYRALRQRPQPVTSVTRGGGSQVAVMSMPYQEPQNWPRFMPPFLRGAAVFVTDGRLWVQRTTVAGEPAIFDVFDESGRLVERMRLPAQRRLVGFGRGRAYLVRRDEVDLEFIERYTLPTRSE